MFFVFDSPRLPGLLSLNRGGGGRFGFWEVFVLGVSGLLDTLYVGTGGAGRLGF